MEGRSLRVLALSGSLRAASSNTALLQAAARLAPAHMRVEVYGNLKALPPFSPDRERDLYENVAGRLALRSGIADPGLRAVGDLVERVRNADGLLVACPEYARGVPGAFKNALDWLVGSDAFVRKPFAQFNASPRAFHAQNSLRTTLETMSGLIVERACIAVPLLNRGLGADAIARDESLAAPVRDALLGFASAIERIRAEQEA